MSFVVVLASLEDARKIQNCFCQFCFSLTIHLICFDCEVSCSKVLMNLREFFCCIYLTFCCDFRSQYRRSVLVQGIFHDLPCAILIFLPIPALSSSCLPRIACVPHIVLLRPISGCFSAVLSSLRGVMLFFSCCQVRKYLSSSHHFHVKSTAAFLCVYITTKMISHAIGASFSHIK